MSEIFIFAGENSGDLYGEKLILSLKKKFPDAHLFGVGGPRMRKAGLETVMEMEKFQVMGFVDVLLAMPRITRQFFYLRNLLLERQPKIALFIDYPGFNLALAKSLHKRGFKGKICHYICPSVWAWGKNRIPKMEAILDHLFVVFPFEKSFFNPEKLAVHFVGHPLIERLENHAYKDFKKSKRLLSLFPGSRRKEIERNLSQQLKIAKKIVTTYPHWEIAISIGAPELKPLIQEIMGDADAALVEGDKTYELMRASDLAIAKSGTVTLELALHQVPTVVTYGISTLDLWIAKYLIRPNLRYFCLVNIIAGAEVFPELFGPNLTEEKLWQETSRLIEDPSLYEECREKCRFIAKLLEKTNADNEIGDLIAPYV